MKPIRAQFVRRCVPGRLWWLVCLSLFAAASGVGWLAWQSIQRTRAAHQELIGIEAGTKRAQASAQRPTTQLPPPYDASAREMLAQAAVPWPALLAALEAVTVSGVRLVSVDYIAAESRGRVELKFTNHAAVLEYVQALSAGAPESGPAWRWKPLLLSQPRAAEIGTATIEATWDVR
jgi:hypothetical protein